ncbi:hypothetical protein ALC57_12102 [Trachymyrmex cornetzi]|uniref:DNA-directed DNA polymerase n=1 Tax=Trachymyrmex cornetzi TaxID=471704 RepID=A0A151J1F0_9HYME|nr:hypothetical protein ALC57_12102 [Trachymyrmex cornetzi]
MKNHERVERELLEQCDYIATLVECFAWLQRYDECIERLEELCRVKRPRLTVGHRQSVVARIALLVGAKTQLERRFVHVGGWYASGEYASGNEQSLVWREIDAAFESRIVTGAVINSNYIEPRRFLEDAGNVVLERDAIERHGSVKVNTTFNGEFATNDKRANKSITTKNVEIYRYTDLREWYQRHVIEPTLTSLEEFQERDSGWALSRILNLTVNVNKLILNLASIEFPMTLKDIPKFERLNAMSINVYGIENKQVLPLRLTSDKQEKHVNVLYMQDPRNDGVGHFAWIKNLSRLVSSQLSRKKNKKFFCDRKPFAPDDTRVRDHCHLTGKYRGPAHSNFNLNYKNSFNIPVVFHNLSGYDAHFIIKEIATAYDGHVDILPITKEKYISFTKHVDSTKDKNENHFQKNCVKLRFIDSYKFLSTSLDKLASFLSRDKLKIVRSKFPTLSDEEFKLLTRKGVFPYEYVDCVAKLNERCLPPRESFYSSLMGDTVSESDYAHAVNVWQRFSIRTLVEYSDLYLKTDVLLLADIFENFRESCVANYGLDPTHYYTLPGFTWDAMLKHTYVRFQLLTDIDMIMFIERGIRGGLSRCSGRYAQANNKYMRSYDSSKPSSYLMYYDVNNLYGWAMCQPLPYAEFRWVEVDLEYPQHLHDQHIDLPFCPTRDKPPGKREDKLLATLYDKQRYIIHYRNLQQCTRHGLRVTKIHRILQFTQSPWLREYIELNTQFRTRAKNDFEKNLYKLMNNAVFGKTMENVRNHVDVKLITKWDGQCGAEAMIAKPNFHSRSVFAENLIAVELRKLEVKFNKPIYVGMCILDISKVCLYEFHHEYMLPLFRDKCKIMYTDTDSLIYRVECEDVYVTMKHDIARFDTSDYPTDNAYGMPLANKKVPGLMKDENNGAIMTEFVGLRAKMYAVRVDGKKDTKKAKGVKINVVARTISFDDYTRCLNEEIEMTRRQSCIRSKLHEVYTISESKIALSPYDDKRYVVPDSMETLPWGHWRIPL